MLDHANDVLQTFVRPAAGAIVAVAASGQAGENYPLVMVALGILLAGSVHAVKAAARPVVNVATGGAGAPAVSTAEDVAAVGTTLIALLVPVLVVLVIVLVIVIAWLVFARRRQRRRLSRAPTYGGSVVLAQRSPRIGALVYSFAVCH